ncbi:unnamed protein product, partial [Effrenium voratum]
VFRERDAVLALGGFDIVGLARLGLTQRGWAKSVFSEQLVPALSARLGLKVLPFSLELLSVCVAVQGWPRRADDTKPGSQRGACCQVLRCIPRCLHLWDLWDLWNSDTASEELSDGEASLCKLHPL